jgi:hypothetical protein
MIGNARAERARPAILSEIFRTRRAKLAGPLGGAGSIAR